MVEFEMDGSLDLELTLSIKELNNKDEWLLNLYEKGFIHERLYDFFIENIDDVRIKGGFSGFTKRGFTYEEVELYELIIYYKNNELVRLEESYENGESTVKCIWYDEEVS